MKKRLAGLALPLLVIAACATPFDKEADTGDTAGALSANGKLDRLLEAVIAKGPNGKTPGVAQKGDEIDVLIAAEPAALPKLSNLAVHVRTVTSSGVMTARVSLLKVNAIAALAEVHHIEVAKKVKKSNDLGNGPAGLNTPVVLRPLGAEAHGGAGVVVGVLDSGLDYRHMDFRKADGRTRVRAMWDQSDTNTANTPAGFNYGRAYSEAQINGCLDGTESYCKETDTDGHGTHVTGSATGNGRAYVSGVTNQFQHAGVAPDADIVFVKFDFDGPRNTDAAIIDGVNWIFQQAAALGKPAVVNLSLGSDYSPHDGSTLEERGLDDLTGAGKIIVVAAGNPGVNVPSANQHLWGWPLHGSGTVPANGYSEITFNVNPGAQPGDYVFFNVWYEGADTNQVQIITPTSKSYPTDFGHKKSRTWKTGGAAGYYNTSDGAIGVFNGGSGDEFGTGSNNGDQDMYIEISDGYGTLPAAGLWKIRIHGTNSQPGGGKFHAWHGSSRGLFTSQPMYQDGPSNNAMTIGSPATAARALAIGAYATKLEWPYKDLDPAGGLCTSSCFQSYADAPLGYYDPFALGDLASFSARGPSRDGRILPTVSAPGVGIVSSLSQHALDYEKSLPVASTYYMRLNRVGPDELHSTLQGTSMASPHAAGAVALLLAKSPSLTPEGARAALQLTARHDAKTGTTTNNDWGAGRLDVSRALDAVCSTNDDCNDGCCNGGTCGAPACTAGSCAAGFTCQNAGTCSAACVPNAPTCGGGGAACTTNAQCCSGFTCGGKPGKRTCR